MKASIIGLAALIITFPLAAGAIELTRPTLAPVGTMQVATTAVPTPTRAAPVTLPQRPAATGVTCTKTTPATGCSLFSCSDGTKLNTCDMCVAPKITVQEGRPTPPKPLLTALAKPRNATSSVRAVEPKPTISWWGRFFTTQKKEESKPTTCETRDVVEGGCTLTYDCKNDLKKYTCPSHGLGGMYTWTAGWCTYDMVGYDHFSQKAECSMTCEKGVYAGGTSSGGAVDECPVWMGIPDKKSSPGANDEYCKENPEDTFVCNPSAG